MSLGDLKDKIKEIPISSIVSQYISLNKRGPIHLGLCPFHDDRNPSLTVNDSKNMFMCFSCQTGGDAISFVQKYRNLEFKDTLKEIADKNGLNYDTYNSVKVSPKVEMAKKILLKTAQIYRKVAVSSSNSAYTSFLKTRKLSSEIAEEFNIGYAPNSNIISEYLSSIKDESQKQFALQVAKEIHIIREDKKKLGSYYDTFRNRIIFPINDRLGRTVGFGGRATLDFQKAKYLNSQESFIFNKKDILYGLNIGKSSIREEDSIILVEGYMDLIALHQAGFKNSVAVMGVALGPNSLNNIKSLTKNIFLALDSDNAGMKAMKRINKLFLEEGIIPKHLNLSPHKDPDDFIASEGALELKKRTDESIAFIDLEISDLIPSKIPELSDRKLEILKKSFEILQPLQNNLSASERIISLATSLGLKSDPSHIINSYTQYLEENKGSNIKSLARDIENKPEYSDPNLDKVIASNSQPNQSNTINELNTESPSKKKDLNSAEKYLLKTILEFQSTLSHPNFDELLDLVDHIGVKGYVGKLKELIYEVDESEYYTLVIDILRVGNYSEEINNYIWALLYNDKVKKSITGQNPIDGQNLERLLRDTKRYLQKCKLKNEKERLRSLQANCTTKSDSETLMKRLIEVNEKLKTFKNP